MLGRPIYFLLCWAPLFAAVGCQERPPGGVLPVQVAPDESDFFFARESVTELKIELSEEAAKSLRENPRGYVKATLVENGDRKYADVAVKLKGAAGSFQELDATPALTLNLSKFSKKQRFHAMEKLHLNNSVQDETHLCEALCSELCREAGVPATRVAHARVWLNERDLGLYVLKEGFDAPFLKRHFRDASGNLYDGGFCTDINEELEKDSGNGAADRSDLQALKAACEIEQEDERASELQKGLDVEAFIHFMALELMMGHWDGYVANRNNYRVYFDPATKRARFLPHGMDQMFQDPDFPVMQVPGTIVASAVMKQPSWRTKYRKRVKELLPLFSAEKLVAKVEALDKPLAAFFTAAGEEELRRHQELVGQLKERLTARANALRVQIDQPEPEPQAESEPLEFNEAGIVELNDWYVHEPADNRLESIEAEGRTQFVIAVGAAEQCASGWRKRVLLGKGKYRLEAEMKASGVAATVDEKGSGGGLRISGQNRNNEIAGDTDWTPVGFDFDVCEASQEVELVAELRATKGTLWIRAPLKLRKLE